MLVFGFRPVMAYASEGEMPEESMAAEFRRAGHRARNNAQCFEVGTVTKGHLDLYRSYLVIFIGNSRSLY